MKIPYPGELYRRFDGAVVQVLGVLLDENGIICVEYATSNDLEESVMEPMGRWLGTAKVETGAVFPPKRFEPLAHADASGAILSNLRIEEMPPTVKLQEIENLREALGGDDNDAA